MNLSHSQWLSCLLRYRAFDWAFLVVLVVLNIVVYLAEPHHRFVNNGDITLAYPRLTETVSATTLLLLSILFPLVVFLAFWVIKRKQKHATAEFHTLILAFALAVLMNLFATDCIKKMTGRPRPNFFALTEWRNGQPGPDVSAATIREAYQSFVSGHSSIAFCGLLFLAQFLFQHLSSLSPLYIAQTIALHRKPVDQLVRTNNFFSLFIPFLPIALAAWIALTRVVDYWHFCEDIVGGALVGSFFAYTCFNYCYLERKWTWLHLHPMPEAAEYTTRRVNDQSTYHSPRVFIPQTVLDEEKLEMGTAEHDQSINQSNNATSSAPNSRENSVIAI